MLKNRWVVMGIFVAALLFAGWKWGVAAAIPYLGLLACPLMCVLMGVFAVKGMSKSANGEQSDRGGAHQSTGT